VTAATPETFGLRELVARLSRYGEDVTAVIESMNGARFVHDQLELYGWDVEIADAVKVKGLAPLAAKTDKMDARVLAELGRRDLVPAIWLPYPSVRAERERARFRLHLVRHRTALKNRIHATCCRHDCMGLNRLVMAALNGGGDSESGGPILVGLEPRAASLVTDGAASHASSKA
jgi:transposase